MSISSQTRGVSQASIEIALSKRIEELEAENKRLREAINEAHQILGLAGERSFKKVSLAADQAFSVLGEFVEEEVLSE